MSDQREIEIGFVDLADDAYPDASKQYSVKSASDASLAKLSYPKDYVEKKLDLTLISLWINKLPEFIGQSEGLLKITINTRNPQNISEKKDISSATEFSVRDNEYAPGIGFRGIFRNVIFRDHINLGLSLIEIDGDFSDQYKNVKGIVENIEGISPLDVLSGVPYLDLATGLVEGIINVFGRNEDDVVWSNIPLLDGDPSPGSAFLRSGIYVAYQTTNDDDERVRHSDLIFSDGKISKAPESNLRNEISNCLAFSVRVRGYTSKS